ncbi:MAG TPA: nitrate- and nitrite sensing domain-containing protein [Actinospica sp.]|nr:nitrate- and nitrite sensing domain-containing protein [Actinospica sp.]
MLDSGTAVRPPLRDSGKAAGRRRWSLRNLRLRKRLILLVLVPLVAGVAVASARVVSEANTIQSENDLNGQAHVALTMAGLIYSIEDERDAVELYLTDGEQQSDMVSLTKTEAATQAQVADFDAAEQTYAPALAVLAPSIQTLQQQAVARLGDLATLRTSVTSLGASRPIYQAYNTIVSDLLNFSGQLSTDTTDHDLASYVSTLSQVEQAGEQTAQERGYLVGILGGNGGQLLVQQEDLVQAQAQYNSTLATINAQAPAPIVDLYQAQVGGDATGAADSAVQQTIDAALQDFPVSQVGVGDTTAFTETTAKVDQIRAIEGVVGQNILDRTSALLGSARDDLYLNVGIIVAVLLLAFFATAAIARSITRPLMVLRTSALEIADVRLPALIERLRDPKQAETGIDVRPIAIDSTDEVGSVARAFDEVHHSAVRLAGEQAMLRASVNAVFTNLSRRSQTLVERQLQLIDDLESGEREPARLAALFRLDHLATRMRRNNENLLVLGGEETARRWTVAVRLVDVARAAAAEVEQYERIILGEVPRVGIIGKAAPDVAHLVAELLENATAFSAPRTKVWIAARPADDGGVLLRIEDAGIGMKRAELDEANDRINNPPVVDVSVARRMGLYVVGRLAARYGIEVRLGESQVGGVAALIHLPAALLSLSTGQPLPGQSQVDDEFYALSRQFDHGSKQGTMTGADKAALLGDSQGSNVSVPMVPWHPEPGGSKPEPAPWYDPRFPLQPLPTEEPAKDTVWFQPSEERKADAPENDKRSAAEAALARAAGRDGEAAGLAPGQDRPRATDAFGARLPQRKQRGAQGKVPAQPQHHARPEPPAAPAEAEVPLERTPIFEAIESEWFRRREQARAASGTYRADPAAEPEPALLADPEGAAAPQSAVDRAPDAAGPPQQQPAQGAGTVAAPTVSPAAVVRSWSSPGDDGWRAAQALKEPAHDGQTQSGLPRRTPRANLLPGQAGGTGAARAVPPQKFRQDPSKSGQA